jgi:hypothetical protein
LRSKDLRQTQAGGAEGEAADLQETPAGDAVAEALLLAEEG